MITFFPTHVTKFSGKTTHVPFPKSIPRDHVSQLAIRFGQNVGIYSGGVDPAVPELPLDIAHVPGIVQEVGAIRVSDAMNDVMIPNTGFLH